MTNDEWADSCASAQSSPFFILSASSSATGQCAKTLFAHSFSAKRLGVRPVLRGFCSRWFPLPHLARTESLGKRLSARKAAQQRTQSKTLRDSRRK
jgi:hypothetical protein